MPNPLTQSLVLGNVWADQARLAGETLPPEAEAAVAPLLAETIEPTRRGSYAEHARQFPEYGPTGHLSPA